LLGLYVNVLENLSGFYSNLFTFLPVKNPIIRLLAAKLFNFGYFKLVYIIRDYAK